MVALSSILRDGENISVPNLRQWLGSLYGQTQSAAAVLASGTIAAAVGTRVYTTQAALFADLAHAADLLAMVVEDSDSLKNGLYRKNGVTGTGDWGTAPLDLFASAAAASVQPLFAATEAAARNAAESLEQTLALETSIETQVNSAIDAAVLALPDDYKGDKGDPGGNILSLGTFASIRSAGAGSSPMEILTGVTMVMTSAHTVAGHGRAFYELDASLTDADLANFPRMTFRAKNSAGGVTRWRLYEGTHWEAEAFGMIPDDTTDCSPAWAEMLAWNDAYPALPTYQYGRSARRVVFGIGKYYFAEEVNLIGGTWILEGAGAGGLGSSSTVLRWPANTRGIIVNRHNTIGDQVVGMFAHKGGDGSIVRNLALQGGGIGGTNKLAHGVWFRARALLQDVFIDGFPGNGVNIVADFNFDTTLGTNYFAGNANDWQLCRVSVNATGAHGYWVQGGDANAGHAISCEVAGANWGGLMDVSFLGNTWTGCTVHGSNQANTGAVSHGGRRYDLIDKTPGIGGTTTPGTNKDVWYDGGAGGVGTWFPAWVSGATYNVSCAVFADNANARSVFSGLYTEGGYATVHVERSSQIIGGLLGGRRTITTPYIGVGGEGAHASDTGFGSEYSNYDAVSLTNLFGTYVGAVFGGKMLTTGEEGTFVNVYAQKGGTTWRQKLDGDGNIFWQYGNIGIGTAWGIAGNTKPRYGRPIGDRFFSYFPNGLVPGGDPNVNRKLSQAPTVPATGVDYAVGEVSLNTDPATNRCLAYICTTGATTSGGSITADAVWRKSGAIFIDATLTYDAPSLAPGAAGTVQTLTVSGAALGDHVAVATTINSQGLQIAAYVSASDTVSLYVFNPAGNPAGTVNLGSATYKVRVTKM